VSRLPNELVNPPVLSLNTTKIILKGNALIPSQLPLLLKIDIATGRHMYEHTYIYMCTCVHIYGNIWIVSTYLEFTTTIQFNTGYFKRLCVDY
jgi:hypothetical protein